MDLADVAVFAARQAQQLDQQSVENLAGISVVDVRGLGACYCFQQLFFI
ncbi:MAG: hypothetical protein ACI9WU_004581 [Myxococcota bacterium]|jgi:hypothetical protein